MRDFIGYNVKSMKTTLRSITKLRQTFQFMMLSVFVCACLPAMADNQQLELKQSAATLHFSPSPTELEIFNARIFDEPLIPIGGTPSDMETKALADALANYSNRNNLDDFSSLTAFLANYPDSKWSGSLLLHLGTEYYNFGYYSKALDAWAQAWQQFKDVNDPKAKAQADRALGELARMYSKLGRMHELKELLESTKDRPLSGPGIQLINAAQQAIWMMQNRPEVSFRCGPMALDKILSYKNPAYAVNPWIFNSKSTTNGFSLSQVNSLARQLGMNYQMAFRSPGAAFILPAVVHWKVGHYAALLNREGGRFLVEDHTFQSSLLMTSEALETESSGYFIVPAGPLPIGWRSVSEREAQSILGKGVTGGQGPGTGPPPPPCPPPGGGGASAGGGPCTTALTEYTMNTMLATLELYDTPVGYSPPLGPVVYFIANYNQLEPNQPATFYYSNIGPLWDFNWLTYVTDNPMSPGANVTIYEGGGGTIYYTGYNSATQSYALEPISQTTLVKTSTSSYEQQFQDGSRREFAMSDGSTGSSRRIFMTQLIDPAGNIVNLNYDASLRLTNIVDALGQSTTLLYTNSAFPYAITSVTDPFGRTSYLQYNSTGMLSQITDVLGITSQYIYGTNGFVNTLVTPYGATSFVTGSTNGGTFLQATDPLGESELLEFNQNSSLPYSLPAATIPHGMAVFNAYMYGRDSFFWDKKAFKEGAWNITNATIYHFLHEPGFTLESSTLESVKKPLENFIWYNYPGQPIGDGLNPGDNWAGSAVVGTSSQPSAVGRVLDDGTTQISYYQYNAIGNITNSIDPVGRTFSYTYATNNVDLLDAHMTHNGKNELLGSFTYNSQHRHLTITDAAGQTSTNTYNANGQILTTTDPKGETTSYSYGTNGYLLSVTGPLQNSNDITSFTYDGFGRVRTVTDTEGYTLTFDYDAYDRKTRITYPDGTYEQFVYNLLDLAAVQDRLGRWTTNTYNADRQLVKTTDPLGRTTTYDWCNCGSLEGITDPMGRTTTWRYDVQSRPIAKTYPDGSTIIYAYENSTSRLKSRWDEKGQQTVYQYYLDNDLKSVSYPNAIVPTPTVTFTYDPDYNRILSMQDGIGTTAYSYNPITPIPTLGAGQLASVSGPLPNSTIAYQYDQLGRVVNAAINGAGQAVTYDVMGRPMAVTNALGTFQYTYVDATARLASEAYPNGQTNLYSYYNNVGDERLQQIQHFYPNGSLLSGFSYAYNPVGQITAWTNEWNSLPTRVWNPGYDAADQLTNVVSAVAGSPANNYAYAYDPSGNRMLEQINTATNQFSYNALNQIGSANPGPTNFTTYEWDAENRLIAINHGTNSSVFSYDGLGRRVQIQELVNGVVMTNNYYLWCGSGICEERDASGGIPLKRYFGEGMQIVSGVGAGDYFYTRDHLGSIRELTDNTGAIRARYDYDPYGLRTEVSGNLNADYGFTGFYYHGPSGLELAPFRAYNSELGRWIARDPIGESGGLNLYGYVINNPINVVDPLGLCGSSFDSSPGAYNTASGFSPAYIPITLTSSTPNPIILEMLRRMGITKSVNLNGVIVDQTVSIALAFGFVAFAEVSIPTAGIMAGGSMMLIRINDIHESGRPDSDGLSLDMLSNLPPPFGTAFSLISSARDNQGRTPFMGKTYISAPGLGDTGSGGGNSNGSYNTGGSGTPTVTGGPICTTGTK